MSNIVAPLKNPSYSMSEKDTTAQIFMGSEVMKTTPRNVIGFDNGFENPNRILQESKQLLEQL